MAEPIEMPFDMRTRVGPKKHVLDAGAHWHQPANMIQPSMFGGDAAFLSNHFDRLLIPFTKRQLKQFH